MAEEKMCCCGYCSVRTGTIIIAVIWMLVCTMNVLVFHSHLRKMTGDKQYDPVALANSWIAIGELKETLAEMYANWRVFMILCTLVMLVGEAVDAVLSALLLIAAIKRGPARWFVPWLGFNICCAVLSILFSLLVTFCMTIKFGGAFGLAMLLGMVAVYFTYFHLLRVVYYYKQELQQDAAGEQLEFNQFAVSLVRNVVRVPVPPRST